MYSDGKIETLVQKIIAAVPTDLRQAKVDMEKNLKAIISAGLAKMDLVTREEFDVQAELLARTRTALEKIQRHLTELEEKTSRKK